MNKKTKNSYIVFLIIITLILSVTGCNSNNNNAAPSATQDSRLNADEITTDDNSSTDKENTTTEQENTEPTKPENTESTTTPENTTTTHPTTNKEFLEDGSISLVSTDANGNLIQTVDYVASQNITIAYVYEYNESGNLTGTYDYQGDGNLVDEFASGNYIHANMSGFNINDTSNSLDVDLKQAFTITIDELAPLYKKAEKIWDTYGVAVLIADKTSGYTGTAEPCFDYTSIENALRCIENCLECYPKDFFRGFSDTQNDVTVCIQVVGTGDSAGFYTDFNEIQLIQMDVNDYSTDDNGAFFWYTLHHEIGHMISYTLLNRSENSSVPLTEENWNSYNPDGFQYVGFYDDDKENELYLSNSNSEYFVFSYSCSTPEEDRAIIFGYAMSYYQEGMKNDNFNEHIDAKLKYFSDCIKAGFDSNDWPDTLAWEYILD